LENFIIFLKADLESTVREYKQRINVIFFLTFKKIISKLKELESANKRFKECPPEGGIAAIQEVFF
jgi:hypothetical protein